MTGLLLLVSALVAASTALVGPVAFFGLLVAALAERIVNTRRNGLLLPAAALTGIIVLVGFGRFPHGRGRLTAQDDAIIAAAIAQFDLADLADRFMETLLGGQRQRALVAMAFAQGTDYLPLEEPLNNLDMYDARALMRSLRTVADSNGKTVVIVLHDINQAGAHADRIVARKAGRIVADGSPADILTPDTLDDVFGFRMGVETIEGKPFVLQQL